MSRVGRLAAALLAVAAVAIGAVVLLSDDDGYVVRAEFADAGGVRKNSDVKVGEVPAGTITAVDLTERDTAIVTMKLDDGVGPVGAGAKARSRPVNLLGEKYVDLDPGNVRAPVRSGTTIPLARTDTAVELDDVLNALEPGTRARLRILINEGGVALAGRGADFNRLLADLPGGLDQATEFLDAMSRDTDRLDGLVARGDRVLAAVSGRRGDLGELVDSAQSALRTTASRREQLARTVRSAPAGLQQLRGTLDDLRGAAGDLRPAAANLRAASGPLATTLGRLPAFADDARGTLQAAREVAPALSRLGTQGAPTVRRLRPTLRNLASFTGELRPLTSALDDKGMKELLRFTNNWANLTELQDGLGHVFRVRLLLGREALTGDGDPRPTARRRTPRRAAPAPAPRQPEAAPAPRGQPRPKRVLPEVRLPELRLPKLERLPDVRRLPEQLTDALPKLGARQGTDPGAPGTKRLLDYLLGG